jgi:pilus assembly protein CpaB
LKRSNRLILLIGFFLAAVAFVAVVLLLGSGSGGGGGGGTEPAAATSTYIVAAQDIPLGTVVTENMVEEKVVKVADKPADAYTLKADAINKTTTTDALKGGKIGPQTFSTTTVNPDIARLLAPGKRAMSLEVSYIAGVGSLIKPGDRVDVVVEITGAQFPVVTVDPATDLPVAVAGLNPTSVKAIIQNLEVVGALLPAPPAVEGQPYPSGPFSAGAPGTQLVLLAVTAQEAEVLRFGQSDGSVTLILRSPEDEEAPDEKTTGITLRQLVDGWAVIPPQIIEAVEPKK